MQKEFLNYNTNLKKKTGTMFNISLYLSPSVPDDTGDWVLYFLDFLSGWTTSVWATPIWFKILWISA